MSNPTVLLLAAACALMFAEPLSLNRAQAESSEQHTSESISYERDVRPIFQANCHGCHQPAKSEGEYVMTAVDRLIAGGESGDAAIVPGHPENSYLIEMITPVDGEAEMPRERKPLSETQRRLIQEWIRQGAKDDSRVHGPAYDQDHPPRYVQRPTITSLDFSPDGETLAVPGFHEVTLYKADGSARIARLIGMSPRIESVRFSPDGKQLAVTGGVPAQSGEVQIWDMESLELQLSLPVTFDTVRGASWSPDGRLLAFGGADHSVYAMDVEAGEIVFHQGSHNDWVLGTVFSKDASHVASVSRDKTAKLLEVATQQLVDNITSVADGALKGGIHCIVRHPLRDEILFGGADGVPKIYRMFRQAKRQRDGDENLLWELPFLAGRIFAIDISPAGQLIAVGSSSTDGGALHLYSMDSEPEISAEIHKILNRPPAVRKPAEKALLEAHFKRGVEVIAETRIPNSSVFAVAFDPAGERVAVAGSDGIVRFIDSLSGDVVDQFTPFEMETESPIAQSRREELGESEPVPPLPEEAVPAGTDVVGLHVTPPRLKLESSTDYVQLVVSAELHTGEVIDATRLAQISVNDALVTISSQALVRPAADGSTQLLVSLAEQEVTVPVGVHNATTPLRPDFQRDVAPVISKLGCNLGKCHGARDGKNGFKLSLRGYDALADVRALTDDLACRRVNLAAPTASLMLAKPTAQVPHEGGQLLQQNSDDYRIVHAWVTQGAKLDRQTPRTTKLDVYPKNPVVQRVGSLQQLRVVATFGDGHQRDVTHKAFIESGNAKVAAEVEGHGGMVEALQRGEASILVRYDGAYAATTLTVMGDREGFVWQPPPSNNPIDEFVWKKLKRTKILPSPLCNDYDFLRRLYLDLTGLPPTPAQIREFTGAPGDAQQKRAALIDQLVGSPEYVEHRSNKWADLLQVNGKFLGRQGATKFRQWIRNEIANNTPYDHFARKLLTASGSNNDNPAAAYYKILRDPQKLMANTTHLFMATRFTCNECHDHPFERWTQDDHYQMAAWFAQVGFEKDAASGDKKIKTSATEPAYPLYEVVSDKNEGDVIHLRTQDVVKPAFPFECDYETPDNGTRRERMAAWISSPDNPYFAKSFANRIWGYFMGRGLIEPLDDIRAGNPPSNPELLDFLAAEFISSGFDEQHLVRLICKSRVYQLSAQTNQWNHDDELNYSHAIPRRLPAEVLYDSIYRVTGARSEFPGVPKGTRAAALPDVGIRLPDDFLSNMGRPARESSCECERNEELQLGVVLALVNCPTVNNAIGAEDNEIATLAQEVSSDRELVSEMFLRVLNRPATKEEIAAGLQIFGAIESQHQLLVEQLRSLETEKQTARDEAEAKRLAELEQVQHELAAYQQRQAPIIVKNERKRTQLIARAKGALEDYENQFPIKIQEWEDANRDATTWTVLDPVELIADQERTTFAVQPDRSILVKGEHGKGAHRFLASTKLRNITGIRLDALRDDGLKAKGPGRSDGSFVLTELEVHRAPDELGSAPVLADWEFDQDPGSWTPMSNNQLSVEDGRLTVKSGGAYPAMATQVQAPAGSFTLEVVARVRRQAMMRVYWSTLGMTDYDKARSRRHGVLAGETPWRPYRFHFETAQPLTGIRLDLDKKDGQVQVESIRLLRHDPRVESVSLENAQATHSQEGFDIRQAIDGHISGDKGWAILPQVGHDHAAIFETKELFGRDDDSLIHVILHQNYRGGQHGLGKFRVSVTNSAKPLSIGIPSSIAQLLATDRGQRSQSQRDELTRYVREHDKQLSKLQLALSEAEEPLPEDPMLAKYQQRIKNLSQPLPADRDVAKLKQKLTISQRQLSARRLTAAQDLAWALINNPEFLYNH